MNDVTTFDFHGDLLFVLERDGERWLPIAPICNALGIAPQMQRKRIQNDPILVEGGIVTILPSPGGPQETYCLRLDLVHGWLFTIDESRVKPEVRDRVLLYKRECYRALYEHFAGKARQLVGGEAEGPIDQRLHYKLRQVENVLRIHGEDAAHEMWLLMGLPTVPSMFRDPLAEARAEREERRRQREPNPEWKARMEAAGWDHDPDTGIWGRKRPKPGT